MPINDEVIDIACDLWVLARQGGHSCGDADLIIAASAMVEQLTLVTGNASHFNWIPSLQIADWRNF